MKIVIIALILSLSSISTASAAFIVEENKRMVNSFNIDKDLISSFGIYKDDQLLFNSIELWNKDIKDSTFWLLTGNSLYTPFDVNTWHKNQTFGFYFSTLNNTYYSTVHNDNFIFDYDNSRLNINFKNNFGNKSSVTVDGFNMAIPEPNILMLMGIALVFMSYRLRMKNK